MHHYPGLNKWTILRYTLPELREMVRDIVNVNPMCAPPDEGKKPDKAPPRGGPSTNRGSLKIPERS